MIFFILLLDLFNVILQSCLFYASIVWERSRLTFFMPQHLDFVSPSPANVPKMATSLLPKMAT